MHNVFWRVYTALQHPVTSCIYSCSVSMERGCWTPESHWDFMGKGPCQDPRPKLTAKLIPCLHDFPIPYKWTLCSRTQPSSSFSSCLEVPLPLFLPRRGLAGSSTGGTWEKGHKLLKSKHIKLHIFQTKSMGTWQEERVSKLPKQP